MSPRDAVEFILSRRVGGGSLPCSRSLPLPFPLALVLPVPLEFMLLVLALRHNIGAGRPANLSQREPTSA